MINIYTFLFIYLPIPKSYAYRTIIIVIITDIERANDLYSRDRYEQIQITEDNSVVSREVTLHKAIIPLLVITKIYGLFPLQNICDQNGSNMV